MITAGCAFLGALAAWESGNALPAADKAFSLSPAGSRFSSMTKRYGGARAAFLAACRQRRKTAETRAVLDQEQY